MARPRKNNSERSSIAISKTMHKLIEDARVAHTIATGTILPKTEFIQLLLTEALEARKKSAFNPLPANELQ